MRKFSESRFYLEGLFSSYLKPDIFGSNNVFKARILSTQEPIINEQAGVSSQLCIVRILDSKMAHEKFLPNPCDTSVAGDLQKSNALMLMHSRLYINQPLGSTKLSTGDDIFISLKAGDNENKYNLSTVDYVSHYNKNQDPLPQSTIENCSSLSSIQWGNSAALGSVFGSVNIPFEDISSDQKSFYKGREVANGRLPEDILATPWAPEYDLYVPQKDYSGRPTVFIKDLIEPFRALCLEFYENFNGSKIVITDTYRTYARQVDLERRKPALAATPGYSNHGWGVAFDVAGTNNCPSYGGSGKCPSNRSIERFQSPVYQFLDKGGSGTQGFVNPPSLRYNGRLPESWHWENLSIRNAVYDREATPPDYVIGDGGELEDGSVNALNNNEEEQNQEEQLQSSIDQALRNAGLQG